MEESSVAEQPGYPAGDRQQAVYRTFFMIQVGQKASKGRKTDEQERVCVKEGEQGKSC